MGESISKMKSIKIEGGKVVYYRYRGIMNYKNETDRI